MHRLDMKQACSVCSILTMLCAVMTNKESSEQTVWAQHFPYISLGTRSETLLPNARSHLMLLVSFYLPPQRAPERFSKRNSSWTLEVFGVWPSAAITRIRISSVTNLLLLCCMHPARHVMQSVSAWELNLQALQKARSLSNAPFKTPNVRNLIRLNATYFRCERIFFYVLCASCEYIK
jgi:hypothetical protein